MSLDSWLAETQAEVKTQDGHVLTVVPVRIQDCLIAGAIPMPVITEMAKLEAEADAGVVSAEDQLESMKRANAINDTYVALSVKEFDREPVEFTVEAAQRLEAVDQAAYREVLAYATRQKQTAGKG